MIASKERQGIRALFWLCSGVTFLSSVRARSIFCGVGAVIAKHKGRKKEGFLNEVVQIDKEKRVEWHQIRAEYVNGLSLRKLADKYGVSFSTIQQKSMREKWTESRKAAKIKIEESVIQKTAEKVADNATLAADIKRKGLLLLNKLFDDYMQYTVTEHRESKEPGSVDVKRLRDLTAAYKDLTEDIQAGSNATNELLQSLLDIERRAAT